MSLRDILLRQIASEGPMRIDDYMATCLLHPVHGYYTTRQPLGGAGDFVTAPEISQMFGELIGLALAQCWLDNGAPAPFTLAELGPGRGTLMADVLRAARGVPGFLEAARVTLVEVSPHLRAAQAAALKDRTANWVARADQLPDAPLFVIANEFFDALPIRQFIRDGTLWRERQVGARDDALAFGLGPALPQPTLDAWHSDIADGEMVESRAAAAPVMAALSERIARHGGAALIVDYGDWRPRGDTFQAVRAHEKVDPLTSPGKADLTAHVDFAALAEAARPLVPTRLASQGVFLERLGITARAQALAARLKGEALSTHVAAHRRLTHPDEMGNLFKVLGLLPAGGTPPPGLDI